MSKRLVPTNVDMYRMYRNRDSLLRRLSDDARAQRVEFDTPPGDQIQSQQRRGTLTVCLLGLQGPVIGSVLNRLKNSARRASKPKYLDVSAENLDSTVYEKTDSHITAVYLIGGKSTRYPVRQMTY